MKINKIQDYWSSIDQKIIIYSADILGSLNLQEDTTSFLRLTGLPTEAAPFLSFNENSVGEWNSISRLIELDHTLDISFANLITIGSDGSGNPIVIDTSDKDFIKLLDHDNLFSPHIINSSIESFVLSLIAYAEFIDTVLAQDNGDIEYDTHFTNEQFNFLKTSLIEADSYFDKSEFWKNELSMLIHNREYYINKSGA